MNKEKINYILFKKKININKRYISYLKIGFILYIAVWLFYEKKEEDFRLKNRKQYGLIMVKNEINKINYDILRYYKQFDRLPNKLNDLTDYIKNLDLLPCVKDVLIDSIIRTTKKDIWGMPYKYIKQNNGYILVSAGKDKEFFTYDDIVCIKKMKRKNETKR